MYCMWPHALGYSSMTQSATVRPNRLTARAFLVSDRIDLMGLERTDVLATNPLAFRAGEGFVVLFRYGVAVLIGLTPLEEDDILRGLQPRISGAVEKVEETAEIEIISDQDDAKIPPGGPIQVRDLSPGRLVVIADALAKSAVLARDEQEVSAVFDVIEPHARRLAERGRAPGGLRTILKLIGNALIVRHRVSGRVAVEEKPDVLWDRPDLERLYARLEDEYELKERAGDLHRKLTVIGQTATALSDLIHTERSLRLEVIIVALILFEVLVTIYQLASGLH
jgi:uncharacterized Rmd1/YagE family protein